MNEHLDSIFAFVTLKRWKILKHLSICGLKNKLYFQKVETTDILNLCIIVVDKIWKL